MDSYVSYHAVAEEGNLGVQKGKFTSTSRDCAIVELSGGREDCMHDQPTCHENV